MDAVVSELGGSKEKVNLHYMCDPNAFAPANRDHTSECMEIIEAGLGHTPWRIVFYDSALFVEPGKVIEDTSKWGIRQYGIGRETATAHAASFLGEKCCGVVKSQDMLDAERKGIEDVVKRVKNSNMKFVFEISYIISPNDTAETLRKTFEEMDYFASMADSKTIMAIKFAMLSPLPGTRILTQHTDLIHEDTYAASGSYERWDERAIKTAFPNSVYPQLKQSRLFNDYSDTWNYRSNFLEAVRKLK
ncbi:MAG TPA: hypothetical protein VFF28_04730 [Candidatus Nanoarchaeia archaeon]|nr:hypothetical protein [Candidatus Nanoarchaeia archaeon]